MKSPVQMSGQIQDLRAQRKTLLRKSRRDPPGDVPV